LPGSLGQLSLPSLRGNVNQVPAYLLCFKQGAFTCVGWQV